MNKVVLIGRSTKDAELRHTQSGKSVSTFTLAVDRDFKNAQGEKETDFIPCVAWGKLAEICERYITKGKQVAVAGRIQTRNYEGKDGQKRYITEIILSEMKLLGSRQDGQAPSGFEPVEYDSDLPF